MSASKLPDTPLDATINSSPNTPALHYSPFLPIYTPPTLPRPCFFTSSQAADAASTRATPWLQPRTPRARNPRPRQPGASRSRRSAPHKPSRRRNPRRRQRRRQRSLPLLLLHPIRQRRAAPSCAPPTRTNSNRLSIPTPAPSASTNLSRRSATLCAVSLVFYGPITSLSRFPLHHYPVLLFVHNRVLSDGLIAWGTSTPTVGHTYCSDCVDRLLEEEDSKCPVCRHSLFLYDIRVETIEKK